MKGKMKGKNCNLGFEISAAENLKYFNSVFLMILSLFPAQAPRIFPSSVSISVYPWLNSFGCGSAALRLCVVIFKLQFTFPGSRGSMITEISTGPYATHDRMAGSRKGASQAA